MAERNSRHLSRAILRSITTVTGYRDKAPPEPGGAIGSTDSDVDHVVSVVGGFVLPRKAEGVGYEARAVTLEGSLPLVDVAMDGAPMPAPSESLVDLEQQLASRLADFDDIDPYELVYSSRSHRCSSPRGVTTAWLLFLR